jgi:RecA/RadA recombinase
MIEPVFELPENVHLPRVMTGIPKLDRILGSQNNKLGMPLRSLYEIYGPPGSLKSSLGIFMAARVNSSGVIVTADIEGGFEKEYVRSVLITAGFGGRFRLLSMIDDKDVPRFHEDVVQELADSLDADADAAVLDSVGAVTPIAEVKGDLSDAIIGRRAKLMASLTRRALTRLMYENKIFIAINHQHSIIGGHGFWTPGGDTLKYGASVRLRMRAKEYGLPTGAILTEAVVTKLRYGGTRSDSQALICGIPDFGISPEMSVVFEALQAKAATSSSKSKMSDGTYITVGKEKFKAIDLFNSAINRDRDVFKPFYDAMEWE